MNVKRRWKRFAAALAALLLTGSLNGCAQAPENQSLTVWVADPCIAETQFFHAMNRFKQAHPDMKVTFAEAPAPMSYVEDGYEDYVNVTLKEYADQMRTELMGKKGPDLILFDENTFPNIGKTMASGVFAPLDPFIEGDEAYQCNSRGEKEPFNDRILEAGIYKGTRYFMPLSYNMPLVLSTKETMEKYGFPGEGPIQHDELIHLLAGIAGSGDPVRLMRRDFESHVGYVMWDGVVEADYFARTLETDREKLQALEEDYRLIRAYEEACPVEMTNYYRDLGSGALACGIQENLISAILAKSVNYYTEPYVSPLLNAEGEIGVYLEMGAAINAYSPNQENAYEFLKYAMEAECYNLDYYDYMGVPVNEKAQEALIAELRRENVDVEDPQNHRYQKAMPDGYYEELREWNRQVGKVYVNTGLDEQMREWFQPFYLGEQSFDSCYQTMENALSILVSE